MYDSAGIGSFVCRRQGSGKMNASKSENLVDKELMKIMVCPIAHAPLVQAGDWLYSTDPKTRRKYPVRDGIPIMLVDESQVADQSEFDRIIGRAKG